MEQNSNQVAFGLIVVGAFFSFTREYLAKYYVRLHGWLTKQETDQRLVVAVRTYLMLIGMLFTIVGLLALLGVIPL